MKIMMRSKYVMNIEAYVSLISYGFELFYKCLGRIQRNLYIFEVSSLKLNRLYTPTSGTNPF